MSEPSSKEKVTSFGPAFRKLDPDTFAASAAAISALQELAAVDQWVCWRAKRVTEGAVVRWTKVPCLPDGATCDAHATANQGSLGSRLEGVRAGVVHGVGFVATAADPYVLIDFDHCRDPETDVLDAEAEREVQALNSYAEVSVSGTGVHVIAKLDDHSRLLLDGADGGKRDAEGVEVYRAKRFFTFTGEHLPGTPDEIVEANDAVQSLWRRRIRPDGPKGAEARAEGEEQDDGLPAEPPELDRELLEELFASEPQARATFHGRRTDLLKPEGTPNWSGRDQALANYATLWSWPAGQIWALLIEHRTKHKANVRKAFRRKYIADTIAEAQKWVADYRAAAEADPRPRLWVQPGRVAENVEDCVTALNGAPFDLAVFQRGPEPVVVRLVETPETMPGRRGKRYDAKLPAGAALLRKAEAEHVVYGLERTRRAVKPGKPGKLPVAADVPLPLARVVLRNATFRPVLRVVQQPTLREDGSILTTPGYDPASGLVYWPSEAFPELGSDLSLDAARAAVERLARPWRALPFAEPVDLAVLLAEALTIKTRHLYARAPGFVHRAPEAGTGKTLAADTTAIAAAGAPAANVSAAVLKDEPELRKLLTTWAIAGTSTGLFDNVERGTIVDSADLSRFITAGSFGDRILGSNTGAEARVVTTVVLTGNGIGIGGETARRFLTVDLDAGVEDPSQREVGFDLEAEVRRDRPELVVAMLTLISAYRAAGAPIPAGLKPFGSFEAWEPWVRFPLVWAGQPDPCLTLAKHTDVDEGRIAVGELLQLVAAAFGEQLFTATEVIEAAVSNPRLREAILQVAASDKDRDRPSRERLGGYFLEHSSRVFGELRLAHVRDKALKMNRYRVERARKR